MRNLIDILGLAQDGRIYYATVAWLLDPAGEHGLGSVFLDDFCKFLEATGHPWADWVGPIAVDLRKRRGRWDIIMKPKEGRRVELLGGFPTPAELTSQVGDPLVCLLPPPGDGRALGGDLPRWTWTRILGGILRNEGEQRYKPFLADLCQHLAVELCPAPAPGADEPEPEAAGVLVGQPFGDPLPSASRTGSDHEVILSEDMRRAYEVVDIIGEGAQGIVYDVRVEGEREFEGVSLPVRRAVLKLSKDPEDHTIELETAVYKKASVDGLTRMLDSGHVGERAYVVLERLQPLPNEWFAGNSGQVKLDPATAVDVFCALLETLGVLQFRDKLVLCDVKPDNLLLRFAPDGRKPSTEEYLSRLAEGAYEPVFTDVGCAKDREVLREAGGRVDHLIGTPLYLPPEAAPVFRDGTYTPGRYSAATDVYSLTLTFYQHLTGRLPFSHRGLFRLTDQQEFLTDLLALKSDAADPIDRARLYEDFDGSVAADVEGILNMGLEPDPEKRATVHALLNACRSKFGVRATSQTHMAGAWGIQGLTQRQTRFARPRPESATYQRQAKAATRRVARTKS